MKVDFSKDVKLGGVPVFLDKDKNATLGQLCREALNAPPADRRLSLEEMISRGRLASSIADAGETDISPEDVSLIRSCLANRFQHAELVVAVYDLLDPALGR
jgi:hypothetical protein